jgi:uncharacterized membrane protein
MRIRLFDARPWSPIIQALFYVALGLNHFWHPGTYVGFMPTHYSHPHKLVLISGAAEILGGLGLLIERTRRASAWGLILLLLIYFDVHIFMALHPGRFASIPVWGLYLRICFQFVLIAWAWLYTRQIHGGRPTHAARQ